MRRAQLHGTAATSCMVAREDAYPSQWNGYESERSATLHITVVFAMTIPKVCRFCGQPLVNRTAIEHLRREQEKFERRIRQDAEEKAAASLRPRLTVEIRRDLETEYRDREEEWKNTIRELRSTIRELRQEREAMRRRADRAEREAATRLRPKLAAEIGAELEETYGRRLKAKDKIIERQQRQVDEMGRRLEQVPPGDRGEIGEEDILQSLQQAFRGDDIKPVGRGKAGLDVVQKVLEKVGGESVVAGTIVYESKDTLKWRDAFVTKAKEDREKYETPHVVVVSRAFPRKEKEKELSWRDGVPIVNPSLVVPVAQFIRKFIVEMHRAGLSERDVARKTGELYAYIRSEKFRRILLDIVEISRKLRDALEAEKRQHGKLWRGREQAYKDLDQKGTEVDDTIRAIVERAAAQSRRKITHRPRRGLQVR